MRSTQTRDALPKGPLLGAPLALLAQEVLEVVHQLLRVKASSRRGRGASSSGAS